MRFEMHDWMQRGWLSFGFWGNEKMAFINEWFYAIEY